MERCCTEPSQFPAETLYISVQFICGARSLVQSFKPVVKRWADTAMTTTESLHTHNNDLTFTDPQTMKLGTHLILIKVCIFWYFMVIPSQSSFCQSSRPQNTRSNQSVLSLEIPSNGHFPEKKKEDKTYKSNTNTLNTIYIKGRWEIIMDESIYRIQ